MENSRYSVFGGVSIDRRHGSYVEVDDFAPGFTTQMTVGVIVRLDRSVDGDGRNPIGQFQGQDGTENSWQLGTIGLDDSGVIVFLATSGLDPGNTKFQTGPGLIKQGVWTPIHFSVNLTEQRVRIYTFGVLRETTLVGTLPQTILSTEMPLCIGMPSPDPGGEGTNMWLEAGWPGGIAHPAIWDKELTPAEVLRDAGGVRVGDHLVGWWPLDEAPGSDNWCANRVQVDVVGELKANATRITASVAPCKRRLAVVGGKIGAGVGAYNQPTGVLRRLLGAGLHACEAGGEVQLVGSFADGRFPENRHFCGSDITDEYGTIAYIAEHLPQQLDMFSPTDVLVLAGEREMPTYSDPGTIDSYMDGIVRPCWERKINVFSVNQLPAPGQTWAANPGLFNLDLLNQLQLRAQGTGNADPLLDGYNGHDDFHVINVNDMPPELKLSAFLPSEAGAAWMAERIVTAIQAFWGR